MSASKSLHQIVQTGDLIFKASDSIIGKIIRKITFSKVNHVGIVFSPTKIFETDLKYGRAIMNDIFQWQGDRVIIIRPLFYTPESPGMVQTLCELYKGTPYSVWDVLCNGALFWLKDEIRSSLLSFLSTKGFMHCDEMSARIVYESTGHKSLKYWEGFTPGMLLEICLKHRMDYEIVFSSL